MAGHTFSTGDVQESLSIMREAAEWLIESGRPMWLPDELTREALRNPEEEFLVMYDDAGNGIATMLLSFEDRFFWPDIPAGESGFIHKLAVRRAYAGQGSAKALILHAAAICRERGVMSLRLDCDAQRESLNRFYRDAGFELVETKSMTIKYYGKADVAMYMMDLSKTR